MRSFLHRFPFFCLTKATTNADRVFHSCVKCESGHYVVQLLIRRIKGERSLGECGIQITDPLPQPEVLTTTSKPFPQNKTNPPSRN